MNDLRLLESHIDSVIESTPERQERVEQMTIDKSDERHMLVGTLVYTNQDVSLAIMGHDFKNDCQLFDLRFKGKEQVIGALTKFKLV